MCRSKVIFLSKWRICDHFASALLMVADLPSTEDLQQNWKDRIPERLKVNNSDREDYLVV